MSRTTITDSTYSWIRLVLTLAIAMVANVGMWAIIVIMPAVEAEFSAGRAEASMPYTLTMIGFALGNFAIGKAVDRFGVTASLIAAALGIAAGFSLATLSQSIAVLSMAQLLVGFSSAVGFGPLIADISHWFVRRRGIAVALVASGNYLSGAISPLILASMLEATGWRSVYLFMAVVTLAGVIPLSLALRRRLPQEAHIAAQTTSLQNASSSGLSPRALQYLLGLAGIGCCVAMSMPQVHIVSYCVDLGYGPAVGAEMLALMLFGGVGARLETDPYRLALVMLIRVGYAVLFTYRWVKGCCYPACRGFSRRYRALFRRLYRGRRLLRDLRLSDHLDHRHGDRGKPVFPSGIL